VLGQILIPVPIVGALVGGMIGSVAAGTTSKKLD
jgi:hypothetical protein